MRHVLPLALATAACSPVTVSGDVDGAEVTLVDAFYVEDDAAFGDDGSIRVVLSGIADACTERTAFLTSSDTLRKDNTLDTDYAAAVSALWRETFPETFWDIKVTVRVPDPSDPFEAEGFDGTDWQAPPAKGDEFTAELTQVEDFLDDSFFLGNEEWAKYSDSWRSDEGSLTLDRSERDGVLTGTLEIDIIDLDDGNDAGSLRLSFNARSCPEYGDALKGIGGSPLDAR